MTLRESKSLNNSGERHYYFTNDTKGYCYDELIQQNVDSPGKITPDTLLKIGKNDKPQRARFYRELEGGNGKKPVIPKLGSKGNPIESLTEYIEIIGTLKMKHEDSKSFKESAFYLFRGMTSDKFKLVGRIHFDKTILRKNKSSYAESMGYHNAVEKVMFSSFKDRAKPYLKVQPTVGNDWEWLALARHHGVPTRILDWSRDPQIAIWFAVQDQPEYRDMDSVVYAFEPRDRFLIKHNYELEESSEDIKSRYTNIEKPFEIDEKEFQKEAEKKGFDNIILYRPSSLVDRIEYQSSWFSVHPYTDVKIKKRSSIKKSGYKLFEPEGDHKDHFRKIYIKHNKKYEIRRELRQFGIDDVAIYKDLDNLGRYLKNSYFKMSDEFFSDEGLRPQNVEGTFKKLQSVIGLYNSREVEEIKYVNLKKLYERFIVRLADPHNIVTKMYTYNNLGRDLLSYRNQREVFLRLIENLVNSDDPFNQKGTGDEFYQNERKKLDYRRVQLLVINEAIENIKNEADLAETSAIKKQLLAKYDERVNKKILERFECNTDKISTAHTNCVVGYKENTVFHVTPKSELNHYCGFVIFEEKKLKEYKDDGGNTIRSFEIRKHLILEFNNDVLDRVVERSQNMCFWITFKREEDIQDSEMFPDRPHLYEEFTKAFNDVYEHKIDNSKNYFKREGIDAKIKAAKEYFSKNIAAHKDIIKVVYGEGSSEYILIPIERRDNLENVHSLLDYIYYALKGTVFCHYEGQSLIPQFSHGNKDRGWQMNRVLDDNTLQELHFKSSFPQKSIDELNDIKGADPYVYRFPYYYGEKLADAGIHGGCVYKMRFYIDGKEVKYKDLKKLKSQVST